ncbi:heavy metal translocating P-type ATPase [Desulfosporosinus metallidurans]|uniref:Cd(2+)-exporting ATPase n=1 Tax=Desulfosporosinus metallidurans TaxID=1888891 RepID=A0A1Q8QRZ5_9FIRM|nr:heavy metal translocating P-type ATPase [Desulfosporosinus metallidurans]OLN30119.1 Cadmium-transporting ATPase [Desulfosporosinus metallidurans]
MLKKELILEGLDCANCAAKIEQEVNELNGVKAYMNFMNKTLTLETESETEYVSVLEQVKSIVRKHEPDVAVKEKLVNKGVKKVLILEGLDCANCAAKIETQTKSLEGVNNATVDFVSKKLTIEASDKKEFNRILGEVTAIVKRIEPDVKVIDADKNKDNKRIVMLDGLGCANCAAKIETEVNNLEGVKYASVDFVSKKLTLATDANVSFPELSEKIEGIVKKIEPDVKVTFEENNFKTKTKENDSDEDEEGDNRKKQITKLVIGGALFAVGMIFKFPNWLELTIFLISYIIVGGDVVLRAIKGIARGQVFSEHFLMSVATIGAFFVGSYPEGVAVMLFYLVGELFQDMAVDHSRKSISSLMDIRPDYANLKVGDELKKVSPDDVSIGDIIVVKPGEKVPLDGKVIEGTSMVDTSALTGESVPRELEPGKDALSGFINKNGVLTVEVTKDYSESTVTKILDLVQNASSRKAPTENFITKFARYYTPVVVFGALALAIIPPLVIQGATFSEWIYRALVFLVVSCPCALVISIPLGFFGGIGGASKRGILVKGSNYLEALNSVETVIFDKTGTLTKGVFKVTETNSQNGYTDEELIEYAAYAESYSNHPIALSIISAYNAEIDKNRIENYQEIAGHGIKVNVNGREVLAGNTRLMVSENIKFNEVETLGTVVHVAIDKKYAGNIVISDEVKEDSAHAIRELKLLGVKKTVMLTGDLKTVGDKIGKQLGLDEVYSELLPADKVDKLEWLDSQKSPKGKLVFVGDGINDAPVLARADIGMAMGGLGSDAAIEAADIVIMTDEPSKIASAIKIAKRTRSIVYQNIVFALGVKAIFLVLGALGIASMWEAVFGDMGVAILAILNAMRVMNTKNL